MRPTNRMMDRSLALDPLRHIGASHHLSTARPLTSETIDTAQVKLKDLFSNATNRSDPCEILPCEEPYDDSLPLVWFGLVCNCATQFKLEKQARPQYKIHECANMPE